MFGRRVPGPVQIVFVGVRAADKANVRAEVPRSAKGAALNKQVPAGFGVLAEISQSVAGAIDLPSVAKCPLAPTQTHAVNRGIKFRIAEEPSRGCANDMKNKVGLRIQLEFAIDTGDLVMLFDKVVAGGDDADAVLFADITL